jgi:hypothetical protein
MDPEGAMGKTRSSNSEHAGAPSDSVTLLVVSLPLHTLRAALRAEADPAKARFLAGFFKTRPGEYAEGDVFWGITVPVQRRIARAHRDLPLRDVQRLLHSKIHEERLTALVILVDQFERGDEAERERIFLVYLRNIRWVNNWDLVDATARPIVGGWLLDKDRRLLRRLAGSKNLWGRRVAMVATHRFIEEGESADSLAIAEMLLGDDHDLIQRAVGWMLREVGK